MKEGKSERALGRVCETQRRYERARVHVYCANEFNKILSVGQRFSNLRRTSTSTFLSVRKENMLCIFCCEVFLLRVVLGFFWGGRAGRRVCKLTEGGNGLCLSLSRRTSFICVPATHNNKHSSNPAQSLGQFKPQESSPRQPPPESGVYKGIHLFF